MRRLFSVITSRHIVLAAIKVSLIVGTLLNLINQFDALLGEQEWRWGMAVLNYLVPYLVSSYSGAVQIIKKE